MNNTKDRISAIDEWRKRKDDEKLREKLQEEKKLSEAISNLYQILPRIKEVEEVANKCADAGLTLYDFYKGYSRSFGFCPKIISHSEKPYMFVGMRIGDIHEIIINNNSINTVKNCKALMPDSKQYSAYTVSMFIKYFTEFEFEFYEYIDKIVQV